MKKPLWGIHPHQLNGVKGDLGFAFVPMPINEFFGYNPLQDKEVKIFVDSLTHTPKLDAMKLGPPCVFYMIFLPFLPIHP